MGNDTWSCDQSKPCKTISRAVELASSGDHILLDGNNTDKDPYNCQSRSPELSGVQINKSLSIMGYGSFMPHIQCNKGAGLQFNGSNNKHQMNVTLSRLLVSQSSIIVQDSSVRIDGCRFERSKGVVINIRSRLILNILVRNSIFYNNSACISVVVNSTKKQSKNIQVVFKMRNSSFLYSNVRKDMGKCILFTESQNSSQSVSCDITLEHTTFSGNKFILPQGLMSVIIGGSLTVFYKTQININISNNNFISNYGALTIALRPHLPELTANSKSIKKSYVKIQNTMFLHNNGFRAPVLIAVSNQSVVIFQNVTMELNRVFSNGLGGAAYVGIDCFLIIQNCRFSMNKADMGGGALYVAVNSLIVKDSFFVGNKISFLLSGDGGALSVVNAETVVIFNTTFRNCSGSGGGAISAEGCGNITIKKVSS